MKKIVTFVILLFIPIFCYSDGWKYISRLSKFNVTSKYIERLNFLSDDYILAFTGNRNIYKSSDQGKSWDSVYNFTNYYFDTFYPDIDCQYYFFNSDDFSGIPGSKKVILKTSDDFKKIEIVNHIDTSSYIYTFGTPFMFDTNNGFLWGQEIISGNVPSNENLNKFLIVTHDGWKSYEKREIPLYFWSNGYTYNRVDNENIICYSMSHYTNIKGNDTIKRGGMIANYNFPKDEWTLIYEADDRPEGYDGPFSFGPHHTQMVNDTLGFGIDARHISYHIDSSFLYYDVIYRTRDGNKTWEKILDTFRVEAPNDIQDMRFYDEKNGVIVGRNGKVLMTNDGGDSWHLEDPKQFDKSPFIAVMFVDWAGQFPIIGTRLDGDIYRYEGNFFKFDFKSPLLFFPRKDAVGQNIDILFRWEELRDATNYTFHLSKDVGFSNILHESTAKQMQFPYNNLEPFTGYWWRVSSTNGTETLWSEPHYFRTKMPEISTISPDCNAIEQPDSTIIKWSAVKGAEKYRIRLSDTATFDTIVFDFENITSTEFKLNKLEYLKKYYWQVQAYRSDETGGWSEICSFTVEDNPASVSDDNSFRVIYPNPAGDFITIQPSEVLEISEGYKVQLFDLLGIEVMSESIHPMTQSHRMNIERLPAGVYYVKIGDKVEKFVKM